MESITLHETPVTDTLPRKEQPSYTLDGFKHCSSSRYLRGSRYLIIQELGPKIRNDQAWDPLQVLKI